MIRKLVNKIAQRFRRFMGIEQIQTNQRKIILDVNGKNRILNEINRSVNELRRELKSQEHLLGKAKSYLEFSSIDVKQMRQSLKFQNFHKLVSLLTPMDVLDAKYTRVGNNFDGGYIMLDGFSANNVDAAYSFGIANDVSWDEEIAKRGIHVYMYDHTINELPKHNSHFHFYKKGVTGDLEEDCLDTLNNLIVRNGHQKSNKLLLKMDIEGNEWNVFEHAPSSVINQFSQIVIEFHGLDPNASNEDLSKILLVLNKINQTHQSIHVHANGYCQIHWLCELALPHLLEVTYIRRADYEDRLVQNTRKFPTKIDQPTFSWLPDVSLGIFAADK